MIIEGKNSALSNKPQRVTANSIQGGGLGEPLADAGSSKRIFIFSLDRQLAPEHQAKFIELRERFLAGFLADYPTLGHLRANAATLGISHVRTTALKTKGHWLLTLRAICKIVMNEKMDTGRLREGGWYAEMLPIALELTGWFKDAEKIEAFVERVKEEAKKVGDAQRRKSRAGPTREQICAQFKAVFPSVEFILQHPDMLTRNEMMRLAKGRRHHWFTSARMRYFDETGRMDTYYGENGLLEWLVRGAGLLTGRSEPEKDIADILQAVEQAGINKTIRGATNAALNRDKKAYVCACLRNSYMVEDIISAPELVSEDEIRKIKLGAINIIHFIRRAYGKMGWYEILPELLHDAYGFDRVEADKLVERARGNELNLRVSTWSDAERVWESTQKKFSRRMNLTELLDALELTDTQLARNLRLFIRHTPTFREMAREYELRRVVDEIKQQNDRNRAN